MTMDYRTNSGNVGIVKNTKAVNIVEDFSLNVVDERSKEQDT